MIRINLLPVRVSKKKAAGKQQLILLAVIVVAGWLANFMWAQSRQGAQQVAEKKVASLRDEIAQLDRIIGEVKNIKDQQAQLREKLDILAGLKAGRSGPVKVLDALATLTPKRLWITKLEEKGGAATINGQAATIDDVSAFMTALKGNPHFTSVELAKTTATQTQSKIDLVEFTLTAAVAYAPKPPAPGGPAAGGPAAGKGR